MDWDNDGKKDLVTGEYHGYVRIYLNVGTDSDPLFSGYVFLKQGGLTFDCGSYSKVHVVDWNNDGRKDVLCGESGGKVWLLINTGTDADPAFKTKVYLRDGIRDLEVGTVSSPAVADWNRDGKKDLIVGAHSGSLYYFENKGIDSDPEFIGHAELQAGGNLLDVGWYSRPDVVDWDEDGVMDILCGEHDGYVYYFHALGPLSLSHNYLSENVGGRIELRLDAGFANGGRNYLLFGSVSGTEPGTPLPGGAQVLPVNWDLFTNLALSLKNTAVFQNFEGVLNNEGEADAAFDTLGPLPGLAGTYISFAYALGTPWDSPSNGVNIEILP